MLDFIFGPIKWGLLLWVKFERYWAIFLLSYTTYPFLDYSSWLSLSGSGNSLLDKRKQGKGLSLDCTGISVFRNSYLLLLAGRTCSQCWVFYSTIGSVDIKWKLKFLTQSYRFDTIFSHGRFTIFTKQPWSKEERIRIVLLQFKHFSW